MAQDSVAGRREFGAQMEAHRAGERDGEFKAVRQDWYLGGEEFGPELLAQVAEKRGDWHYGAELAGSDEARAERLIGVELQRKSLTVAALQARRKGDAFKVRLAAKLRAHTTVTASWDVERLCTGTR